MAASPVAGEFLAGDHAPKPDSFGVVAVKVVILTTFEHDDYIFGALSAGASGFLLKRTRRKICLRPSTRSPPATRCSHPRSPAA
jgi:hypothetical protein